MAKPVFISYARKSSSANALALHKRLGGSAGLSFLDIQDLELGERFPKSLAEAVLQARVVVVFGDEEYFARWYCLREWALALAPFHDLMSKGASVRECDQSLSHIVIALPAALDRLPPALRTANWPAAIETESLGRLVEARLRAVEATVGEPLGQFRSAAALENLLDESAIPSPASLEELGIKTYSRDGHSSLGSRFIGRANELWSIHYALSMARGDTPPAATLTSALKGGAGYGKTTLATEYVHRFGRHYPGGVFWIDADVTENAIEEQFHGILRVLDPEVPQFEIYRGAGRRASKELRDVERSKGTPALVVIDNVPDIPEGEASRPLETWCPIPGNVAVLATSRSTVGQSECIRIDELDTPSAVRLLSHGLDRALLRPEDWEKIANWVGNLPLALELLNGVLRERGVSPQELLDAAGQDGQVGVLDDYHQVLSKNIQATTTRAVTQSILLSYRRLSPRARDAAQLLAQLSHEPIPLAIVRALGPNVDSTEVRASLHARSWVTPVRADEQVEFYGRMHRVLADFLRNMRPKPGAALSAVCVALVQTMGHDVMLDPGKYALLDRCLPHAERVLKRSMSAESSWWGPLRRRRATLFATLAANIGDWLRGRGLAERACDVEEAALLNARAQLGVKSVATMRLINGLGGTRRLQGQFAEARRLHEEAVALSQRVLGSEHTYTLNAIVDLAWTIKEQGDLVAAKELLQRVVHTPADVLDPQNRGKILAVHILIQVMELMDDLTSAKHLATEHLDVIRNLYGTHNPETAAAMHNLAHVMKSQGDLTGARPLEEESLNIVRRCLGEEHPHTLVASCSLATTMRRQGQTDAARTLATRVLEAQRRVLGNEHPNTLVTIECLARTLELEGDFRAARELLEEAVQSVRRTYPREHDTTLSFLRSLALTMLKGGDLAGAERLEREVVQTRKRLQGPRHPDTLRALNNLAYVMREQGNLRASRRFHAYAFRVQSSILPPDHPDTLTSKSNLARTLTEIGEVETARQLAEEALAGRRHLLGAEHPSTLISLNNFGLTLAAQGDFSGAAGVLEEALTVRRRVLGPRDPDTSVSAHDLWCVLSKLGLAVRASTVLKNDLLWLLDNNPSGLGLEQGKIRRKIAKVIAPDGLHQRRTDTDSPLS